MEKVLVTIAANIPGISNSNHWNDNLGGQDKTTMETDVVKIINIVIGALGIIAVVVIIIGGIGYMTSSGDAGKVKKAKDTILYGIIGLVVCALAFAIVNWVVGGLLGAE